MRLAARLAWRELRGGVRASLRALGIVLACLALGVTAIAAVGTLREGVDRGLAADGARIIGGDLDVAGGAQPLPGALRDWLVARGARLSDVVTMRSMLVAPSGERMLVEVKAVDAAWPLVGQAAFSPAGLVLDARAVAVEPLVRQRLGLKPGDRVRLGAAEFVLAGEVAAEPDRVATPSLFGPRALLTLAGLARTGLEQPGAISEHRLRAVFPPGTDVAAVERALRAAFPAAGWRLRDPRHAAPAVQQVLDRMSLFMTLVGLTALLVGGIGVANGTRAWLAARTRSIATLRCLGASGALVFQVAMIQLMALAALGIVAGLALGVAIPLLAAGFLQGVLPVPARIGVYPGPLALAGLYGVLTAWTFALWPLGRAMRIPGAALFRDAVAPARPGVSGWLVAANLALAAGLVGLTVLAADDRWFALWFCLGAIGTLVLFRLGATALVRLARRGSHAAGAGRVWLRLGLTNLHRPGNATPLMLVSVGIGLSTLAVVALIQGNLRRQVLEQLPARAPSFFFIDIQNDQMARFRDIVGAQKGVTEMAEVPSLRARLVSVNGVPAQQVRATPETQWALRGDRGLTYAALPPEGTRIVAGQWWPPDYDGPPLVSFDAALARGWGVGVGDTLVVNVLGRDIALKVASLRDVAWRTLGINFTLIASPGLISRAPHTHIATVRAAPDAQAALLRAVTDALPNVSAIRVADVLQAVSELMGQVAAALAATGSVTLAAGGLVLVGAVAAGQQARIRQAVVLKTLGATRGQMRAAWMVEFGLLGLCAGVIAAAVGTAASWGVARFVMRTDWAFLPGTLAATVAGCVVLMLVFGYAGTEAALRAKAAPLLRNE
jgi:putative ABC transport system permease protein